MFCKDCIVSKLWKPACNVTHLSRSLQDTLCGDHESPSQGPQEFADHPHVGGEVKETNNRIGFWMKVRQAGRSCS